MLSEHARKLAKVLAEKGLDAKPNGPVVAVTPGKTMSEFMKALGVLKNTMNAFEKAEGIKHKIETKRLIRITFYKK